MSLSLSLSLPLSSSCRSYNKKPFQKPPISLRKASFTNLSVSFHGLQHNTTQQQKRIIEEKKRRRKEGRKREEVEWREKEPSFLPFPFSFFVQMSGGGNGGGGGGGDAQAVILATAGYDHTIRFWEALSGICYRTVQYPDSV